LALAAYGKRGSISRSRQVQTKCKSARLTSQILQFGRGLAELLRELPMLLRKLPVFVKEHLEGSGSGIGADLAMMKC